MDNLTDRKKFLITPIVDPQIWIGASLPPMIPGATAQVITEGEMKEWTFRDWYLVLNDSWYSTFDNNDVVVRSGVIEGTKWVITQEEQGIMIKSPDDDTYWTLTSVEPEKKVILAPIDSVNPECQLWRTIVPEE